MPELIELMVFPCCLAYMLAFMPHPLVSRTRHSSHSVPGPSPLPVQGGGGKVVGLWCRAEGLGGCEINCRLGVVIQSEMQMGQERNVALNRGRLSVEPSVETLDWDYASASKVWVLRGGERGSL